MSTDKTIALLQQFYYCNINTDVMAGFEAGMRTAKAWAPEHLAGQRWADWQEGHKAARRYLETRRTYFHGEKQDGTKVEIVRKGWVARSPVVSQMERQGVSGDVFVTYVDGSSVTPLRTVRCGI